MTIPMADVDVLVVGGGPSGITTAAEVARTGASVLVVEKRTNEPIPRAGTVLPRPLELFDARGIADRFIKRTCEINPHPFQSWHIWAGMAPVDWSRRESRFGFTLMLPQSETEAILREWAAGCGANIEFEQELIGIEQDVNGVRAMIRDGHGVEHVVTARYIVGADGGRSRVRECVSIDVTGHGDTFTGIIATANWPFPWPEGSRVRHNEHGWMSAAPFGVGLTRFTIIHAERRSASRSEPVTVDEVNRCATDIFGEPIEVPSLAGGTRYGDAMWMANKFRNDRVFLVGEAARVHYPASGVGMNFCIQDAFNLGWKLGAVVNGKAGADLLDTYESERRPIAEDLFASVNAQVAIQFDFTPRGLAFRRHFMDHFITMPEVTTRLWAELNGLETRYPQPGGPDNRPVVVGFPAPDVELFLLDGTTVRLYELLRTNTFVVLDLDGHANLRGLDLGDTLVVEAHAVRRPDAFHGITTAIIRPDTYVAWASNSTPTHDELHNEMNRIRFLNLTE